MATWLLLPDAEICGITSGAEQCYPADLRVCNVVEPSRAAFYRLQIGIMDAIEQIKGRLQKYPHAKSEVKGNRITVFPSDENGFTVSLVDDTPSYTVCFGDAWHEEFDDEDKALNAFAFGLSDDCRLKVCYRGNFAHKWIVEQMDEDGEWFPSQFIGCSEMGLLVPPLFWLKKRYVYLQNTLLKSDKSGE